MDVRHTATPTATARPRATSSRIPAVLLVSAALAVAGALLALRMHFQPPTVPSYSLVWPGGDAGAGGGSNALAGREIAVVRGGRFVLEAHPAGPVVGAVGARAFLLRDAEVRPWDPPFDVDRDGSVRIAGAVDKLFSGVPDGAWEIAIVVGRPETLPTAPRDIVKGSDDAGVAAWRLLRERVRLGSQR